MPHREKSEAPAAVGRSEKRRQPQQPDLRQEEALDHELEDTFPASDPPQMTQPHVHPGGPDRPANGTSAGKTTVKHPKHR